MSVFTQNVLAKELTDLLGIGAGTLNADGSVSSITGVTIRRVTAAPTEVDNAGSLAMRTDGTLYVTTGGGTWFPVGGGGSGWQLPDNVSGIWGTNAPGQVSSTYVSIANTWNLLGDAISQATAASGAALRMGSGANTITGAVAGSASSNVDIFTGVTNCTNAGGTGGASGDLSLFTGSATSTLGVSGASGGISITTGDSDDANSGGISFTTGTAGGTRGSIVCSAAGVRALDDVPFSVGTLANDRFNFQYAVGTTTAQLIGASITGGGATQATRPLSISTGVRLKNDNNAGVPASGALDIGTGSSGISFAGGGATGGVSGNLSLFTGSTDCLAGANTAGNSGNLSLFTGACTSTAGTSGTTGSVSVVTGNSDDANSGSLQFTTGNAAAGTSGSLVLTVGTGVTQGTIQAVGRLTTTDGVTGGTARVVGGLAFSTTADSTTITGNGATQAFDQAYIIPANTLKAGTSIRVSGMVRRTGINGVDVAVVTVRLGGTTYLTSAIVIALANEICFFDCVLTARATPGAAVAVVGAGSIGWSTAGAAMIASGNSANLATNGALTVDVQITMANNVGNTAVLSQLQVVIQ